MNKKTTTIAIGTALLMTAMALASVTAYHIEGNALPGGILGSGDWETISVGVLNVCESDGPNDPRNNLTGEIRPGSGGLCTTGENNATGVQPPNPLPTMRGDYIRLDVCSATVDERGGPGTGILPCSDPMAGGATDQHGYTARVGPFTCFIPTDGVLVDTLLGELVTVDYAAFYDRLLARFAYDGATGGPGYHGHAAVFIDVTESNVGARNIGSVETTLFDSSNPLPDRTSDGILLNGQSWNGTAGAPWGLNNNCGNSPVLPPSLSGEPNGYGPMFRAPYDVSLWTVAPSDPPSGGVFGSAVDGVFCVVFETLALNVIDAVECAVDMVDDIVEAVTGLL